MAEPSAEYAKRKGIQSLLEALATQILIKKPEDVVEYVASLTASMKSSKGNMNGNDYGGLIQDCVPKNGTTTLYAPKMSKEAPLYKMLVNGEFVESGQTFGVVNPSTGEIFSYAPECSAKILNDAVKAAKDAFVTWKDTPAAERKACLEKAIGKTKEALPEIKEILIREQGKPSGGADFELGGVLAFLSGFMQIDVSDKVLVDNDAEKIIEKRLPLGVIGGICPWNFPVLMAAWKVGEAVVTGNTMVVKSSPYTPLSTLAWAKVVADCFPKGVLNIVSGTNEVGEMITKHPDIAKVSFTGSINTGKKIQEAAASTLKHVTLELGGNDAAIVLPEADVKSAAAGIYAMSMVNSGQVCIAVKRCYVHEKIHDEFVAELAEQAKKAVVGDGFKEGVEFGPINNKMQFDKVCKLVADAKEKPGAKVHAGGAPLPGNGYFFPPTIFTGLGEDVDLVKQEQFGPVLPVMKYSDVDDAVFKANNTLYGLGGSAWGPTEKAAAVAEKIEAGTVWVNQHANLSPDVPFGGVKESGIGRQMGPATIDYYTEAKIVRMVKDAK
jgi:acyl-CoA reductase-like NAD-dependent aldehyde dehydrogenase